MKDLDKMLREAIQLELLSRPYNRVSVIRRNNSTWIVKGIDNKFRSFCAAAQYCGEAAAGRDYHVIVDDIPHKEIEEMPEGYVVPHPSMMSVKEVGLWHDSE